MATTPKLYGFLCVSKLFLLLGCLVGNSNGLTLKLIHRDSPESPYYQPNLTPEERLDRLFNQSRLRDEGYLSGKYHMNPETIQERIHIQDQYLYMVMAGIGTFRNQAPPYKQYLLHIDTGSSLTWTQCEDCRHPQGHCFHQSVPPFPRRQSRSFRGLLVAATPMHPLCDVLKWRDAYCAYEENYSDESSSSGILGEDYFTFESSRGATESVRIVFGCGYENLNFYYGRRNRITGILGLGWGSRSFVNQLGDQSHGLFSYCLLPMNAEMSTFLRFGNDIMHHPGLKTTPLLRYEELEPYHVMLQGISINGERLHIQPQVFERRNRTGGTIIDSGTAVTHLVADAYQNLRQTLVRMFSRIQGLHPTHDPFLDLCYTTPGSFGTSSLPRITFHFDGEGAELHVKPEEGFVLRRWENPPSFCLAMLPSHSGRSMIGAYQQINHRFVYDTRSHMLHFGPEDCRRDV